MTSEHTESVEIQFDTLANTALKGIEHPGSRPCSFILRVVEPVTGYLYLFTLSVVQSQKQYHMRSYKRDGILPYVNGRVNPPPVTAGKSKVDPVHGMNAYG
jgi:hypothetical protein